MNDDARFARGRLRQAWPVLEALGFDKARLADTAHHLARASATLRDEAEAAFERLCRPTAEGLLADATGLTALPEEIGLRVLAAALMRVSGQAYRPRFVRLARLYAAIRAGELTAARTLHGCKISPAPKRYSHFGAHLLLIRPEMRRRSPSADDI